MSKYAPFVVDVEVLSTDGKFRKRELMSLSATCGLHARRIVNKVKLAEYPRHAILIHSHRKGI